MHMLNLLVVALTLAWLHLDIKVGTSSYFLEDFWLPLLILLPKSAKNPTKKKNQIF